MSWRVRERGIRFVVVAVEMEVAVADPALADEVRRDRDLLPRVFRRVPHGHGHLLPDLLPSGQISSHEAGEEQEEEDGEEREVVKPRHGQTSGRGVHKTYCLLLRLRERNVAGQANERSIYMDQIGQSRAA